MIHSSTLTTLALTGLLAAGLLTLNGCCGECGDAAKVIGGTGKLIAEMASAPGTGELKAAGCDQAMVITPEAMERFVKTIEEIDPEGAKKNKKDLELEHTIVACTLQNPKADVTCEEMAKVYGKAVTTGPNKFGVTVNVNRQNEPKCSGLYDREGKKLGDLDTSAVQSMGGAGR